MILQKSLEEAIGLALKRATKEQEYFFVSIAWVGSTPYVGWNSLKTDPKCTRMQPNRQITHGRHAEAHCLSKIPHDVDGRKIKMVLLRFLQNGRLGNAYPCPKCFEKIVRRGIPLRNVSVSVKNSGIIRLSQGDPNG